MSFVSGLFNDQDKTVNPTHVLAYTLCGASVIWISYLVFKTKAMPDVTGVAYLLSATGVANVAHKLEDIVGKFQKRMPPPPGDVPPINS
jgi:hypothetical protein